MSDTHERQLVERRKKLQDVFGDLAPIWLFNDEYRQPVESFYFSVVYRHPVHGWVKQHIRYDTLSDVLYHIGESHVSETEVLQFQEHEPYMSGNGKASIPNNPGHLK